MWVSVMNASYLLVAIAVVVLSLLLATLVKRTWFRVALAVGLYLCVAFSASFGMGGLRTSIEQARDQGKSEDFVMGLATRSHQLLTQRFLVLIFGSGLVAIGVSGWLRPRSKD